MTDDRPTLLTVKVDFGDVAIIRSQNE